MRMTHARFLLSALVLLLAAGCVTSTSQTDSPRGVKFTEGPASVTVEINGKLFTEYHFKNVSRPFLYPLIGPGDARMTRNWPMQEVPDEERDHPHHRSLWYAHGDINGHDFWSESDKAGKTVHQHFELIHPGSKKGTLISKNQLVAKNGAVIGTDTRKLTFYSEANYFDFEITIEASHGELTLGDTKEGSMAIRLAETMRLKGKVGKGHIVNSEGVRDGETWGKRAKWCDYYGPVEGKTVGIAIFDHPQNPRHPTWWHVRDYGLFAANPFGVHDFEKRPAGTGNLIVPAGKNVSFRYRFYLHEGNEVAGKVAEQYDHYARTVK